MNESESRLPETLPLAAVQEVDAVCERFLAALEADQRPRIEDYLGEVGEPARSTLLRQLLLEELEYRDKKGERPAEEEYLSRFSGPGGLVVRQVFAAVPQGALPYVPGYKVLAEVGRGGMGVVYKAWQLKAERFVALKMILAGEMASADDIERFKGEARAAASLNHPSIVTIYDVDEHEGRHYFTMELVAGGSLAEQIARGPMPSRRAAEIVLAVAQAVHHAHQQKVIHRDLKPANILLDAAGQPHVTDFGLAKRLDRDADRTRTGVVLGTPGYMAPEQAAGRGKEPTAATDVYGLGAVLYALLTGWPPFQAETLPDILDQVIRQRPQVPRMLNPNIDRDLETICLKCLEKNPAARYPTAEKLAEGLRRYLSGEPIEARPPTWAESVLRIIEQRREVLPPGPWSYVCLLGAAVTFATHAAIFWITRLHDPAFLFLLCIGLHELLARLIAWRWVVRRRHQFTTEEGVIASVFGTLGVTALCLSLLAYPWDPASILALYPALGLIFGFYNFVIARLYWGPLYLHGLAYYLLALVMRLTPEWAPLEYAVVSSGLSLASALVLRRYARRSLLQEEKGKDHANDTSGRG